MATPTVHPRFRLARDGIGTATRALALLLYVHGIILSYHLLFRSPEPGSIAIPPLEVPEEPESIEEIELPKVKRRTSRARRCGSTSSRP
jgi:hypothetical protein